MVLSIFRTTSKSLKKFLSQTTSLATSEAAIYSVSMVESTIMDYFTLLHIIAAPSRVNTEPDIDFLESLSPWKSKSVYPNIFRSSPEFTKYST